MNKYETTVLVKSYVTSYNELKEFSFDGPFEHYEAAVERTLHRHFTGQMDESEIQRLAMRIMAISHEISGQNMEFMTMIPQKRLMFSHAVFAAVTTEFELRKNAQLLGSFANVFGK